MAHSLAEAETAAAAMRPELFVLDLDPPPSGEIEFFNKLKAQYPEARVLVIAAGTSRELRAERGTAGAIQFIEKPFDLAEFGAAVQALLGPWAAAALDDLRGTLRDLHRSRHRAAEMSRREHRRRPPRGPGRQIRAKFISAEARSATPPRAC